MTFAMTQIAHLASMGLFTCLQEGQEWEVLSIWSCIQTSGSSQGKFLLFLSFPVLSAGKILPVTQELWLQFLPYFHTAFS